MTTPSRILLLGAALLISAGTLSAKRKPAAPAVPLEPAGEKFEAQYAKTLSELTAEITKTLPQVSPQKIAAFDKATEDVKAAEAEAKVAQDALGKIGGGKALIDHAKGKWIGGAEKGIAAAEAALKKATTAAEREAAQKELADWQANKEEGLKALKERTEAYEAAKAQEPALKKAHEAAQAALAKAKTNERNAANAVLGDLSPVMATDQFDAKLAKAVVIHHATPRGLAEFSQQSPEHAALVASLLANEALMKEMLIAGGARFGKYGRAIEIYAAIQKASPKAKEGVFQRLALATSLEHAQPINQTNLADQPDAPVHVDPVKRYLNYEGAFLAGDLDPAFKNFSTWEYRHVVNCDAPEEIVTWGRNMLQTYRPDHIFTKDYGWRYVMAVKTEVPYGSQNVKYDLPTLHKYQNIPMNGGICGRRAFFGRYILRAFGIPTWGVTQKAHAALSHWTPKGWVVNLGAGFHASWWDKDEVSMSGTQFLLETQAREHADEYLKVLRAQWVGRILGEPAYNERRKVSGGAWSRMGHFQALILSEKAEALGPLGQELAEANEKEQKVVSEAVSAADQKIIVNADGSITIPAVAHGKGSGKASAMRSYTTGMQLHALGGFKAPYEIDAPKAGTYQLSARVATLQTGQIFILSANNGQTIETPVPYTKGLWEAMEPVVVTLEKGKNILNFELKTGSRAVTIKDFTLTPIK